MAEMARHTLVKQQALQVTPSSSSVHTAAPHPSTPLPPTPILPSATDDPRGPRTKIVVTKRQWKQPECGAGAEEQPQ